MEEEVNRAPFNMALSTLEKLQKTLVEIKRASVEGLQLIKLKLILSFHNQSTPLISNAKRKKDMKSLRGDLRKINPGRTKVLLHGNFSHFEPNCNKEVDFKLDDILEKIQGLMQEEGYFMPPSQDEDLY